jgi:hypothetical protein
VAEFKNQSMRAAKKRAKRDAAERAMRAAEALAAAAAADDSGNSDGEEGDKSKHGIRGHPEPGAAASCSDGSEGIRRGRRII